MEKAWKRAFYHQQNREGKNPKPLNGNHFLTSCHSEFEVWSMFGKNEYGASVRTVSHTNNSLIHLSPFHVLYSIFGEVEIFIWIYDS